MSRFNVLSPEFWEKFENDPATAEKFIIRAKQVFKELQDPMREITSKTKNKQSFEAQTLILGFDLQSKSQKNNNPRSSMDDESKLIQVRTGLKLLGIDICRRTQT